MSVLDNNIRVLKFFEEISMIPRGSFKEEKIADYLVEFAKQRELKYVRDGMHNVVIFKDASIGYENHEPVMLQGHSDMVNEKNNDCKHDFDNDPLDLYIENGILKARGTTLGADDGCGVAIILSLLDDQDAKHPPLECVFTVQEEVGLFGAMGLDTSILRSRRMIGLDSSDETKVTVSSSGGKRVVLNKKVSYEDNHDPVYVLTVKGISGGHSGSEISKEKGHAIQFSIRLLHLLIKNNVDVRIVEMNGGLKDNAIPRECVTMFASETSVEEIEKVLDKGFNNLKEQYQYTEPQLTIELEKTNAPKALSKEDTKDIVSTVYLCPHGFIAKSIEMNGLTLISLNNGVIKVSEGNAEIRYSIRSPLEGARDYLTDKISMIADIYGFSVGVDSEYGGWAYDSSSKMRKLMKEFFKNKYDVELEEHATHGGLESGVFCAKMPGLDIVAYGPNMYDIHSPEERLELDSFVRVYQRIKDFLEVL